MTLLALILTRKRRAVLGADREHGHEIRAGMRWLTEFTASHRLIGQALAL